MAEYLISTLAIGNALARTSQGINRESFPLEVFPQKVQKLILHLVKHRSFKLESVASCMIAATAAAIGNSRRIRSREGWEVAPMFYMILVGRPGIGKTPPLEFAFRPLCDIDREREKVYAEQYKEYQVLKAQYEKSNSQGEPPVAPKLIRTLISDFTQEAMVMPQSITTSAPKSQFDTLGCTLEELAVLRVIENNPKSTQTEIAKSMKKSSSTVKRITSSLVEKGILIRRNGRRNGWWEILK